TIMMVKIKAPTNSATEAVRRAFAPILNQPLDTKKIESLLTDIRSNGRYDADYTVGYDSSDSSRPIVLVTVSDKKTGPPFLDLGVNIAASAGTASLPRRAPT